MSGKRTQTKVTKLSKLHEWPKRPKNLRGAAREEWDRVAPRLFSMGRLQRQEGLFWKSIASTMLGLPALPKISLKATDQKRNQIADFNE